MIDFTSSIEEATRRADEVALVEALDYFEKLTTDPGLGTEFGPSVSDVKDALAECERLLARARS